MSAWFQAISQHSLAQLPAGEGLELYLRAEETDFVRLNHGKVRQPGSVTQRLLTLRRFQGARHAEAQLGLTGHLPTDTQRIDTTLAQLRAWIDVVPEDPYLLRTSNTQSLVDTPAHTGVDGPQAIRELLGAAAGLDLVGIWASGAQHVYFANEAGLRHASSRSTFHLDYSVVASADRAIKDSFAGERWQAEAFAARLQQARARLPLLRRPPTRPSPGEHRAWLAPAAVAQLFTLISRGTFSAQAQQTHRSPWGPVLRGEAQLDPRVHLVEDYAGGPAPRFSADGFCRPAQVPLLTPAGVGTLVSPRSAMEYGLETTGADARESLSFPSLAPGDLPTPEVLKALGTGLWISNLWYLNWSDAPAGRLTGMTRFATMWVEEGEIVGPLEVMRFDDTLMRMFGEQLEALGDTAELHLSAGTYEQRALGGARVPGLLLSGLRLVS